jgi:basic membrane protein A and related proteins
MRIQKRRIAISTITSVIIIVVVIVVAAIGGVLYFVYNPGGSTTTTQSLKVFKILMFTSTPSTTTWGETITTGIDQAISALNNTHGYTLQLTTAFNIGYGSAASFMSGYASQGYNLIMAQDVGYVSAVNSTAGSFPSVYFWGPTFGSILSKNVGAWEIDHWKGEYEAGVVAGLMTKSNVIGFVTAFNYSSTIEAMNAYYAGAKLVNHNVRMYYEFSGDWADSVKGASAASALAAEGADVIAGFGDGMTNGVISGAQSAKVFAIGYLGDQNSQAPQTVLTSVLLNTTKYYVPAILSAENNTLGMKDYTFNLYPDNVSYVASFHGLVPANVSTTAYQYIDQMTSGKLTPPENFTTPIQGE